MALFRNFLEPEYIDADFQSLYNYPDLTSLQAGLLQPEIVPLAPFVAPPVALPPVISPPDDFGMLRRMQEFRETAPTVPVAPAEPRISEDVGLVPSRIVEPPFIQRDEVVTSPQLIDRPSLLGPPKEEPSGNTIDFLAKQILGQGTSGWSGEGFGSSEANAKDMARILAEAGITDINQFGTKIVDVPESRIFVDDEFGGSEQVTPASQRKIYYNKATGQEIMPNYSRAGGNIWSGTFAGKGSTGYGVRFDAQGNPQFYTEYGGTTSDWVPFRENILKPAALAAAAIYGIPLVTEALTGAAAGAGAGAAGAGAATAAELAAAAELASAAGTLGTASAIPNILVTAGKLAPVMTAAEIAALAAPVATGLLSTPSVTPSVPEPSNVIEVVAPKPTPTITPIEAVAATTPVVAELLSQPAVQTPEIIPEVVEPSATMEVTGAKIRPPLEGIFPAVGASLLANAVTTPTTTTPTEPTQPEPKKEDQGFLSSLTPSQIANLLQSALGLFGAGAAGSVLGGGGEERAGVVGALPYQTPPVYDQSYFDALNAYYGSYLPGQQANTSMLSSWYNQQPYQVNQFNLPVSGVSSNIPVMPNTRPVSNFDTVFGSLFNDYLNPNRIISSSGIR
jgi:hypothetical protein